MHTKTIQWMGRLMVLACDGNCSKAWGITQRPKEQLGADDDDAAYLADSELGEAPHSPGTYESGCTKPLSPSGMNKWCARECERSDMASTADKLDFHDWSQRAINQPWKHRKTPNVGHQP